MRIVDHAALTHVGLRREVNEDNYASLPDFGVWAVADGMGGHDGGEIASQIARDQVVEGARLRRPLSDTVVMAHQEIIDHPLAGGDRSMGTTLVAIQAHPSDELEMVWVGDSRIYLRNARDGLVQCSRDQTLVQQWVDEGILSKEAARVHPSRNVISQALGIVLEKPLYVERSVVQITGRTRVLLCSDGLTEHVGDLALDALLSKGSCEDVAQALVQEALDGGGSDNVTVVVVDLDA